MEPLQAFLEGVARPCAPDEADALARLLEDVLARARLAAYAGRGAVAPTAEPRLVRLEELNAFLVH